jgi:hypothetical protein
MDGILFFGGIIFGDNGRLPLAERLPTLKRLRGIFVIPVGATICPERGIKNRAYQVQMYE